MHTSHGVLGQSLISTIPHAVLDYWQGEYKKSHQSLKVMSYIFVESLAVGNIAILVGSHAAIGVAAFQVAQFSYKFTKHYLDHGEQRLIDEFCMNYKETFVHHDVTVEASFLQEYSLYCQPTKLHYYSNGYLSSEFQAKNMSCSELDDAYSKITEIFNDLNQKTGVA